MDKSASGKVLSSKTARMATLAARRPRLLTALVNMVSAGTSCSDFGDKATCDEASFNDS